MNIEQVKQIDICCFLDSIGERCAKKTQSDAWYYAPDRDERTASLHIYKNGTRWYDFGSGKGGDIIDLVQSLFGTSTIGDTLAKLEELTGGGGDKFIKSQAPGKEKSVQSQCDILSIGELSTNLLMYSRSRGIHDELIKKVCKQVNFRTSSGKVLYGIGFQNDCQGWEIRNAFYKGCIGKKFFTSQVDIYAKPIVVCEGVFDYLSLVELRWIDRLDSNFVVLNSTALVDKALSFFISRPIILCLDNDAAGKEAGRKIREKCIVVDDWSDRYRMCKDVNEFLMK